MNPGDEECANPREQKVPDMLAHTCVVVVTFRPDPEVLDRQLNRLSEEGTNVVLVDNNSPSQAAVIEAAANRGFECVALERNIGVAGAQNAGIDRARVQNSEYVVLMDQDSVPEKGAMRSLIDGFLGVPPGPSPVAAVGSSYTLPGGKAGSSFVRFAWFRFNKIYCGAVEEDLPEVDFLISSGSLIPMSVLAEVGPMRKELFIDHVDTEWFLRAKSMGYRSYGCCSVRMTHALGERVVRIWLGRWRTVPVHKSFRYYFTFRNSLWLYRQAHAPLKWITADLVRLLYILVFSAVFLPARAENMKCIWRGIRAGFQDAGDWDSESVVQASIENIRAVD